jgi:hypothetical protein
VVVAQAQTQEAVAEHQMALILMLLAHHLQAVVVEVALMLKQVHLVVQVVVVQHQVTLLGLLVADLEMQADTLLLKVAMVAQVKALILGQVVVVVQVA